MCMFYASTELANFPFILFNNRDESFDRPTAAANWWPGDSGIYAPRDLLKKEKGTWIGASRSGRIAVLVNKFEAAGPSKGKISRGELPKQFLLSELSPSSWVESVKADHKDQLKECGGFTMLVGAINETKKVFETKFLSNYDSEIESLPSQISMALSNGSYKDPTWKKIAEAELKCKELQVPLTCEKLTEIGLEMLNTTNPEPILSNFDLRKHIFIPPLKLHGNTLYGTRTQTVIILHQLPEDGAKLALKYIEIDVKTGSRTEETVGIFK